MVTNHSHSKFLEHFIQTILHSIVTKVFIYKEKPK